jgi:HK97 family phage prohead protease
MNHFDLACEFKLLQADKPGTLEGYASKFNIIDRGGDVVMPNAFSASLSDWRRKDQPVPMLWCHNPDQPIGVWTELAENDKGLKVKGELVMEVAKAQEAHALVKRGAVGGLSIGFVTKESDIDKASGARRLKKIDLWEVSLVTIPALPEATITGVKGFEPEEMERLLRDVARLSRRDAKAAVSVVRNMLQRDAGEPEPPRCDAARDVLMELRKATESLRAA